MSAMGRLLRLLWVLEGGLGKCVTAKWSDIFVPGRHPVPHPNDQKSGQEHRYHQHPFADAREFMQYEESHDPEEGKQDLASIVETPCSHQPSSECHVNRAEYVGCD